MTRMIGILAMISAAPAAAATCPAATPFAGFERAVVVAAAAGPVAAGDRSVRIGQAVSVALAPAAGLRFAVPPGRAAQAGGGGSVGFDVATAGRYRVGAEAGVWIDVIEAGRALPSVAHGHGPDCGPVRKIVDFELKAGRHLLQLSGAKDPTVTIMIAPAG